MKVALLTMFNGLSSTYSVVNVVAEQLRMLLDHGYDVKMLVTEHCKDSEKYGVFLDDRIEWARVANTISGRLIKWHDYQQAEGRVHDSFFKEVQHIAKDLVRHLSDADICLMHDIHYQGWHLVHNVAVRKVQKQLPNLKFIAFTHSAPADRPEKIKYPFSCRFHPMPNTEYVYPTASGIPALSKQYNVSEEVCHVVSNSLDVLSFLSEEVQTVVKATDLLSAEYVVVYPGRLTPAKKFEKVAALCGCIKKVSGKRVKVVFCDFNSQDIDPETYKIVIHVEGGRHGLKYQDITFTSDLGFTTGFPRRGVLELFSLSNLFICPSFSESFGLTVLEAARHGNFLVLNEAVPALEELGKKLNAYFLRWDARNLGFETKETYHPSEKAYYEEHVEKIISLMDADVSLKAKSLTIQQYNPEWVWRNQLQPLLQK